MSLTPNQDSINPNSKKGLRSNLIQDNVNPKPKKDIVLSLTPNQDSEAVNPNPKKGPEFDSHPRQ